MTKVLIFVVAFVVPHIYWRVRFRINPRSFDSPYARTKLGLQIHHMHHGIILLLIGNITLLVAGLSPFVIILSGLGLGLIMDEYIASLILPGDREVELQVYQKSARKTTYLFLAIIGIIILLGLFSQ